jgi:hypothetical protein
MNVSRRLYSGLCIGLIASAPQFFAQRAGAAVKPTVDLSGVWVAPGGRDFDKNPQSEWSAESLPFTAKGRAAFAANKPGKGPHQVPIPQRNDPIITANPPGLYRTLIYGRPMTFGESAGNILQVFEWGRVWRAIYTDGRPVPDDVAAGPYWYGYSVGRWEADALVVTTLARDSRAWFDEWGTPITDGARVEERWQRVAPDKLQLKITVTDPELYSKPWTSMPIIYRLQKAGVEPQEIILAPIDESVFNETVAKPASSTPK